MVINERLRNRINLNFRYEMNLYTLTEHIQQGLDWCDIWDFKKMCYARFDLTIYLCVNRAMYTNSLKNLCNVKPCY